jgi:predicted DNA binding CopG/RHH family protein
MKRKVKLLPRFHDETEERRFWEANDSSDYVDWSRAERVRLPNLRPSTRSISLRLPVSLLERIKIAANNVPYQSLAPGSLLARLSGNLSTQTRSAAAMLCVLRDAPSGRSSA